MIEPKILFIIFADGAKVMNSALNKDFEVHDKTKTPSIPIMMDLLKKGPFIASMILKSILFNINVFLKI